MSSKVSPYLDGFLLLDKPAGLRSTDCVSAIKRALGRGFKVGHAGTLDSTARGLLVILIGKATRLCRYVMDLPKQYEGTVLLGKTTSTDDDSGDVLREKIIGDISDEDLFGLVPSFLGVRMQRPPSISAIRVDGQRAHSISRKGQLVQLPPRPIFISSLSVERRSLNSLTIKVTCHKGTYVRSIARDIGEMLGCGAHLEGLVRTSIGPFHRSEGLFTDEPLTLSSSDIISNILPLHSLCDYYGAYLLPDAMTEKIRNGLKIPVDSLVVASRSRLGGGRNVILMGKEIFSLCRLETSKDGGYLTPETNLILDGGESS